MAKLEQNMADIIKEQQIKLGYRSEKVRLYYPMLSLERLLEVRCTAEEMREYLKEFCNSVREKYGDIEVSDQKERFCFLIPAKGSDYIHEHREEKEFLSDFIQTVRKHGCTLEEALHVFRQYSDHLHIEKTEHGEFDYLVYFEDGVPDDFLYCLSVEGEHIIYHRFTKEDYEDFGF
jgi:arginyl-tRNA--protein-N-Asp/Glu arginylyltransferase